MQTKYKVSKWYFIDCGGKKAQGGIPDSDLNKIDYESRRKAGVLIIGGGIIGLSIAYYVSLRDYQDVEVIEREPELTLHASGHNAGGIGGLHEHTPRALRPLFERTPEIYAELARTPNFEFEYNLGGTISLVPRGEEAETERRISEFRRETGARVQLLNTSDLRKREPHVASENFNLAIYYPYDAQGNSKKLGQCFEAGSVARGHTKISTGVEVLGFTCRGKRIESVKTTRGTIEPEIVVLSAGPWTQSIGAKIPNLALPIKPIKGHLITTEVVNERVLTSFIDGPNYYVMQTKQGNLVVGGGEDDTGFDVKVEEKRIQEAWSEGVALVPRLKSLKRVSISACLRPYAPDGIPIIGRTEKYENLIVAAGHFRFGFSLAPITGKLVSQLIVNGRPEIDLADFSCRDGSLL